MERLPPSEFGRVLRSLIRERWKTQVRYADEIGCDQTWIAKVIRGDQENLTYQSLLRLLEGFKRSDDQEELHSAWLVTYAPSPLLGEMPELWSTDDELVAYAESVHERISAGAALETFHSLGRLWHGLKEEPKRAVVALTVGGAFAEAAQQLDRIAVAKMAVAEMVEKARSLMEPAVFARCLWLRGLNARLTRPRDEASAEAAFIDFAGYLGSWQPRSQAEQFIHGEYEQIAVRDQVLCALDLHLCGHAGKDFLARRVNSLCDKAKGLAVPSWEGLAAEVIARSSLATGDFDLAQEALRKARACSVVKANEMKVMICEVQIYEALKDRERAAERLEMALNMADEYRLVHHRRKLATIEQRLETPPAGKRSFPL